jgi:hypothetical protein
MTPYDDGLDSEESRMERDLDAAEDEQDTTGYMNRWLDEDPTMPNLDEPDD